MHRESLRERKSLERLHLLFVLVIAVSELELDLPEHFLLDEVLGDLGKFLDSFSVGSEERISQLQLVRDGTALCSGTQWHPQSPK